MTNTEKIFHFFDKQAQLDEQYYLEGIIAAGQRWISKEEVPDLTEMVTKEDVRRGIQLAILKGMKTSSQPHHQMTPDALALLIGHFVKLLSSQQKEVSILDPAVGTGNLLFAVMNTMDNDVSATAIEIDELLVRLAAMTSNLIEQPVTFYVQDALRALFVDPVDIVVSDLPVGYYPDDENAVNFELMPTEGHAFAHHLFIEQSMHYTKPGGYGIFLVPNNLFDSDQSSILHSYLKKKTVIQAVLQLPLTLFKNPTHAKSIIILQKPSIEGNKAKDVLLAKVPDMTNREAVASFLKKMDEWATEIRS